MTLPTLVLYPRRGPRGSEGRHRRGPCRQPACVCRGELGLTGNHPNSELQFHTIKTGGKLSHTRVRMDTRTVPAALGLSSMV